MGLYFKRLVSRILGAFGLEVRYLKRSHSLAEFLRKQNIDLVLDVGANVGQFALLLRASGYSGKIASFEPVSAVFKTLKEKADHDNNWFVYQCAVGALPGTGTLHVSRSSDFSSFKRVSAVASHFGEASNVVADEAVEIITVDQFMRDSKAARVFLKMDTQGYDQEVLEGVAESLTLIVGLQIELSSTPLYEETWSISEALRYIEERGFSVCQVWPVNYLGYDTSVALEFDFVCCANSKIQ